MSDKIRDIKRAQKESLLLREISHLFLQASMDDSKIQELSISRVKLSPDKGTCWVYFYSPKGKIHFDEILEHLKLYKPSLRSAVAKKIKSRYVPQILFKFDEQFEKEQKMQELLDKIKEEGEL